MQKFSLHANLVRLWASKWLKHPSPHPQPPILSHSALTWRSKPWRRDCKQPTSAVSRSVTTQLCLWKQINLPCFISVNVSVLSHSGTQKRSRSRPGLASEERKHTGWALRIDPQGHHVQSGRTNKRCGSRANLFNRPVAQQISPIHELKQFLWLEAAIMSSPTLAAVAPRLFLEISAQEGKVAIKYDVGGKSTVHGN